ncbi:MAG TPA: TIGR02300 family protein [Dongiaceae bacterium]|nr:TIGR02300 family protein [Dongiaceae bacterium]
MSKPEWGTKRTCQSCSAHFYDLRKDPIVCPKCGTTYDPEAVLKSRRGRVVEKVVPVKPAPEEELPDVEAEIDEAALGEDDEDAVMEDTSDLGEDDEDVSEIVEGGDEDQ